MRARSFAIGALLTVASLAVAMAVVRSGGAPAGGARLPARETAPTAKPSPPPVAPERLRDIFRFADEAPPPARPTPGIVVRDVAPVEPAQPASGPRLVGLVWRSGRLLAALAVDDEVILAGPGDSAGGVTVVSVDEESVRIRRGDGSESTLGLP